MRSPEGALVVKTDLLAVSEGAILGMQATDQIIKAFLFRF